MSAKKDAKKKARRAAAATSEGLGGAATAVMDRVGEVGHDTRKLARKAGRKTRKEAGKPRSWAAALGVAALGAAAVSLLRWRRHA